MVCMSNPHKHGGRSMILTTSSSLGKSDILVTLANDLAAFVRRGVQESSSLDEVERGVLGRVLDMGAAAVDLFLGAQGEGDLGPSVQVEVGRTLYRSASVEKRPLRTIFGAHVFEAF